jgi:hypothetical protein
VNQSALSKSGLASSVPDWAGLLVPAVPSNASSFSGEPDVVPSFEPVGSLPYLVSASSAGLYFTSQCAGYTDVTTGACTNASDPRALNCAFGSGTSCRPCPVSADGRLMGLCPGGDRLIVLPGFYTPSESSGVVEACPPPATARCVGWDAAYGTNKCGEGYRSFSYLCSSCEEGYYQKSTDNSCVKCPQSNINISPLILTGAYFLAGIAGAVLVVLGTSYLLAKAVGGSVSGAAKRTLDLVLFLVMLLQVLAAVGKSASPGLPPFIERIFSALSALQLEAISTPSACYKNLYPFASEVSQFVVVLALSLGLWAWLLVTRGGGRPASENSKPGATSTCARLWSRIAGFLPGACFAALSLLYSIAASSALTLVKCDTIQTSLLAYTTLNRDDDSMTPESLLASGRLDGSLVTVSVLSSNPSYVCYQGDHKPAGVLAWLTLVLFVAGYPLWTCLWLRWRLPMLAAFDISQTANGRSEPAAKDQKAHYSWWHRLGYSDRAERRRMERKMGYCSATFLLCLCGRETAFTRWWRRQNPQAFQKVQGPPSLGSSLLATFTSCFRCCSRTGNQQRVAKPAQVGRRGSVLQSAPDAAAVTKRVVVRRFEEDEEFSPLLMLGAATSTNEASPKGKDPAAKGEKQKSSTASPTASPVVVIVPGILQSLALDRSALITNNDPPTSHFVGTAFRARLFYSRQLDMVSLALLACIQSLWPTPSTPSGAAGRGILSIIVVLTAAWHAATRRPDVPGEEWKTAVKVVSLVVAALGSLLTSYAVAVDLQYPDGALNQGYETAMTTRTALSWLFLVGCIFLALTIITGFWTAVVRGSEKEQEEIEEEKLHPGAAANRSRRKFGSLAMVAAVSSVAANNEGSDDGTAITNPAAVAASEVLLKEAMAAFAPLPEGLSNARKQRGERGSFAPLTSSGEQLAFSLGSGNSTTKNPLSFSEQAGSASSSADKETKSGPLENNNTTTTVSFANPLRAPSTKPTNGKSAAAVVPEAHTTSTVLKGQLSSFSHKGQTAAPSTAAFRAMTVRKRAGAAPSSLDSRHALRSTGVAAAIVAATKAAAAMASDDDESNDASPDSP